MSPLGVHYPPDVFLRTPVSLITKAAKTVTLKECEQANALSHTTAQLVVSVLSIAHGFSGSKSKFTMSDPEKFLPYSNLRRLSQDTNKEGPSAETKEIMNKLLKTGVLPMSVYAQLSAPPA